LTKKQALIILAILQAALIGLLFLPVATDDPASGGASLNAVDLAIRYAAIGRSIDSGVYLFFALACPSVSLLAILVVRRRRRAVGTTACLSAMGLLVHACFYTAIKSSVTMNGRYAYLIVLSLLSLLLCIYAYLFLELSPGE
jgi:hypothetical protein